MREKNIRLLKICVDGVVVGLAIRQTVVRCLFRYGLKLVRHSIIHSETRRSLWWGGATCGGDMSFIVGVQYSTNHLSTLGNFRSSMHTVFSEL